MDCDPTRVNEIIVDLGDVEVLAADDVAGKLLRVHVRRRTPRLPCWVCGLLMPGTAQRRSHDYRRCGTTDLFAALDAASGKVITAMTARHRSEEFRKFLNLIDTQVPDELDVHIVSDNVFTHKTPAEKPAAAYLFPSMT